MSSLRQGYYPDFPVELYTYISNLHRVRGLYKIFFSPALYELIFYYSICRHLSRNPLICEKLAVLLPLICDEELLVVDDATCTVHEKTNTTSSNNIIAIPLTDYCSNGK